MFDLDVSCTLQHFILRYKRYAYELQDMYKTRSSAKIVFQEVMQNMRAKGIVYRYLASDTPPANKVGRCCVCPGLGGGREWRESGGGGGEEGGRGFFRPLKRGYNSTLLPSVNTIALGMFHDAKYTHYTFTPITKHH